METTGILSDVLILLLTAVFVVAIFKKLNLSPVLGYFVAGALITSRGLEIMSVHDTMLIGEYGVVFLLFAIGLELSFDRLKSMRSHVFGFGSLQVVITAFVISMICLSFGLSKNASIIIGSSLALSSTAIVLQVIAEKRQQSTQTGRVSLSALLMQDFAIVPLIILVPILAGDVNVTEAIGKAVLNAVVALVGIFIAGRIFLRPVFKMIISSNSAKSNEIFVAATLLIALGSAWITEHMGLSLALGAFVAGILVAETEFHVQAEESINPFKGLFLGLFFMSVGMSIELDLIVQKIGIVTILTLSLIFVKALILFILCLIFRFSLGTAIQTSLLLSQGGELAFIIFDSAFQSGLLKEGTRQILLLVITVTMALTPLLATIGKKISDMIEERKKKGKSIQDKIYEDIADLENHVIIVGFGRVGIMVSRLLSAEKIHYVAVDINPETAFELHKSGFPIYAGDASTQVTLRAVGIDRCKAVILAMKNEVTSKKVARAIRKFYPDLSIPIVSRSEDLSDLELFKEAGVDVIVPETYETGLQIGGAVLKSIGISEFEVSRLKNKFRAGNYILAKDDLEEEPEEDEEEDAKKPDPVSSNKPVDIIEISLSENKERRDD